MDKNLTDVQRRQDNIDKTWALLRSANTGVINNASDEGNAALGGWLTLIKSLQRLYSSACTIKPSLTKLEKCLSKSCSRNVVPKKIAYIA